MCGYSPLAPLTYGFPARRPFTYCPLTPLTAPLLSLLAARLPPLLTAPVLAAPISICPPIPLPYCTLYPSHILPPYPLYSLSPYLTVDDPKATGSKLILGVHTVTCDPDCRAQLPVRRIYASHVRALHGRLGVGLFHPAYLRHLDVRLRSGHGWWKEEAQRGQEGVVSYADNRKLRRGVLREGVRGEERDASACIRRHQAFALAPMGVQRGEATGKRGEASADTLVATRRDVLREGCESECERNPESQEGLLYLGEGVRVSARRERERIALAEGV